MALRPADAVPLHGRSLVCGPWGEVLAECAYEGDGVAVAEATTERLEEVRRKLPLAAAARWP